MHLKCHGAVSAGGTWHDLTGRGNNATLVGSSALVDSSGLSLPGNTSNYASCGNSSDLRMTGARELTVMFWVKFNNVSAGNGEQAVVSKNENGGYGILFNSSSDGYFSTWYSLSTGGGGSYAKAKLAISSFSNNTWYHIAGTYSAATGKVILYVNGVNINEVSVSTSSYIYEGSSSSYPLFVGANPGGGIVGGVNGAIDDVMIFARSLPEEEVKQRYQLTKGRH